LTLDEEVIGVPYKVTLGQGVGLTHKCCRE